MVASASAQYFWTTLIWNSRSWRRFALAVSLSLLPIAAVHAGDHIRWTEEVKLSDGKVIQIQRHLELTDSGFPLQKRGFDVYYEICYPPLGVHWKSRGGYKPDIFDIVDGKAYMHVPVTAQAECAEQGSPDTGAIYFVWEAGHWKRIAHDEFPASSEWNLLLQTKSGEPADDPRGLVTLADKVTGPSNDAQLLREQKRLGWKRLNESYARREGCKRWGKVWCADETCQRGTDKPSDPIDIFVKDSSNTCQR